MLKVNHLNGFGVGGGGGQTLMQILTAQGLTATLLFCVDAGDSASYSGAGQQWTDVSGAGNHFNRGTTSGAEASDPTFNGTPGGLSENEYFSCDGGDYFTAVSSAFSTGWAKSGGEFTVGVILRPPSDINISLFGTADASADNGVLARWEGAPNSLGCYYDIANGAGHSAVTTTAQCTINVPNLGIYSLKDSTQNIRTKINRAAVQNQATAGLSALTNAPQGLSIGAFGNGNQIVPINTRIYGAVGWSTQRSAADMDAFATAIAVRFPSMP